MRITVLGLGILGLASCTMTAPSPSESQLSSNINGPVVPTTNGKFVGHYTVPSSSDLAAAAKFAVPEVHWTVVGTTVTLDYDLPVGLVGGPLDITLTGTIAAGATTVALSGIQGTGACTASGTVISCSETFGDLGSLPISMSVVQQDAATTFSGPAAQRVAVANLFSSDPIGTVDFDVSKPADDDGGGGHGGGHGGGGGGGGPGRH